MTSRTRLDAGLRKSGAALIPRSTNPRECTTDRADDRPMQSAPPIVHQTLQSPGEPLDRNTRLFMESRFGYDFSRVRVHSDERAARSAAAVGAAAYAVGRNLVFGTNLYRPHTAAGRALLAHELVHVTRHEGEGVPSTLRIGRENDAEEREAHTDAPRLTSAMVGPHHAPPLRGADRHASRRGGAAVLRRTTLGALIGGGAGLLGGVLLGGLLGGPIGAVVGGAIGLIAGAVTGELATTRSRRLSATELALAKEIYLDSIDYSKITITRDSVLALGAPRTIGNTIHLKSDWGHFKQDTLELTEQGQLTLIHEMAHVWQYQNGGLAYIPQSLWAQLKAAVSGGDRGGAYRWRAAHDAGIPWEQWNPEQQASAIEEYNELLQKQKGGRATPADLHVLSILLPYVEKVRRREGAPTFGGQRGGQSAAPQGAP